MSKDSLAVAFPGLGPKEGPKREGEKYRFDKTKKLKEEGFIPKGLLNHLRRGHAISNPKKSEYFPHYKEDVERCMPGIGMHTVSTEGLSSMIPEYQHIVVEEPLADSKGNSRVIFDEKSKKWQKVVFPKVKPNGRDDVRHLKEWLDKQLTKVLAPAKDSKDSFEERFFAYTVAYHEVVRQVAIQCSERGDIMLKIWEGITGLFETTYKQLKEERDFLASKSRKQEADLSELQLKLDYWMEYSHEARVLQKERDSLKAHQSENYEAIDYLSDELAKQKSKFKELHEDILAWMPHFDLYRDRNSVNHETFLLKLQELEEQDIPEVDPEKMSLLEIMQIDTDRVANGLYLMHHPLKGVQIDNLNIKITETEAAVMREKMNVNRLRSQATAFHEKIDDALDVMAEEQERADTAEEKLERLFAIKQSTVGVQYDPADVRNAIQKSVLPFKEFFVNDFHAKHVFPTIEKDGLLQIIWDVYNAKIQENRNLPTAQQRPLPEFVYDHFMADTYSRVRTDEAIVGLARAVKVYKESDASVRLFARFLGFANPEDRYSYFTFRVFIACLGNFQTKLPQLNTFVNYNKIVTMNSCKDSLSDMKAFLQDHEINSVLSQANKLVDGGGLPLLSFIGVLCDACEMKSLKDKDQYYMIFEAEDLNRDNRLSMREYIATMSYLEPKANRSDLCRAFRTYVSGNSNYVTMEEYLACISRLGITRHVRKAQLPRNVGADTQLNFIQKMIRDKQRLFNSRLQKIKNKDTLRFIQSLQTDLTKSLDAFEKDHDNVLLSPPILFEKLSIMLHLADISAVDQVKSNIGVSQAGAVARLRKFVRMWRFRRLINLRIKKKKDELAEQAAAKEAGQRRRQGSSLKAHRMSATVMSHDPNAPIQDHRMRISSFDPSGREEPPDEILEEADAIEEEPKPSAVVQSNNLDNTVKRPGQAVIRARPQPKDPEFREMAAHIVMKRINDPSWTNLDERQMVAFIREQGGRAAKYNPEPISVAMIIAAALPRNGRDKPLDSLEDHMERGLIITPVDWSVVPNEVKVEEDDTPEEIAAKNDKLLRARAVDADMFWRAHGPDGRNKSKRLQSKEPAKENSNKAANVGSQDKKGQPEAKNK